MVVDGWLARAAAARPEHPALLTSQGPVSYERLYADAWTGAAELEALGAASGARVGIALPAGAGFARALHACLMAGAAAVPIDLRLSEAEQQRMRRGCAVVVAEPLPLAAPGAAQGPPAAPGIADGTRTNSGARTDHDLDATALVLHTSGTSAEPKEVELTHGNLLWSALGSAVALGAPEDERWLCVMPLSHMGGLSILVRSTIYATTAVVHEQFELDRVMDALRGGKVTIVSLVATTLQRLLDAGLQRPPGLRCVLLGGGPVSATLRERARAAGVPVALTYGLTEACSQVATVPVASLDGARRRGAPPLFCTRVEIAPGEEILVRGPTVAPAALADDGWLHTGDLGELDGDGWLSVLGRRAETIISGGENVAPAEVESVLESHPSVLEAGVFGVQDGQWGEAVSAVVVLRGEEDPDGRGSLEELRAHCAKTLAPYKVPKRISLSPTPLPRTRSGKLLRRELG